LVLCQHLFVISRKNAQDKAKMSGARWAAAGKPWRVSLK